MSLSLIHLRRPAGAAPRLRIGALAAATALSLAWAPWALAQSAAPEAASPALVQMPTLAPLVKKVMSAVVNVSVTEKAGASSDEDQDDQDNDNDNDNDNDQGGNQEHAAPGGPNSPQSPFDEFLRRFFQQQGRNGGGGGAPMEPHGQRMALGSGFIIDASGDVVTNNHVVANADKVTVIFQDDSTHPAKVVGRDPKTDLALIKIDAPHPLPFVEWGDSDAMQVGDWVLAVGNPFGLGGTVSSGIISARGRDIHAGPYDDFLQIDAAINRGNSGGPTFALDGKVIGINTAIYSPNGGSVGIGFAIPSNLAKPVIDQLKAHGKVERGWLGVQIQEVTPELAKSLGLPKAEGALVADVTPGGPAEKVGIRQGDAIVKFDGRDIAKLRDLPLAVAETPVGEKAQVEVWRDGHSQLIEPAIAAMPDHPEQMARNEEGEPAAKPQSASTMGMKLAPLTAELRRELSVPKNVKGVVVTSVADSSPLAELGLAPGDVIQAINQEPVASPKDVTTKLDAMKKTGAKNLLFLINRHGVNQFVALTVGGGAG
jgi:serine protease Do